MLALAWQPQLSHLTMPALLARHAPAGLTAIRVRDVVPLAFLFSVMAGVGRPSTSWTCLKQRRGSAGNKPGHDGYAPERRLLLRDWADGGGLRRTGCPARGPGTGEQILLGWLG